MNTQDLPFHFRTIVSGDFFYDRRNEGQALHDEITGGPNVVLYAPRRYSKTSLAMRVAEQWKRNGFTCLYFDHMRVDLLDKFLRDYADATRASEGRTERSLVGGKRRSNYIHPSDRGRSSRRVTPCGVVGFRSISSTAASCCEV